MNNIKLRYVFKEHISDKIFNKYYNLSEVESGIVNKFLNNNSVSLISIDLHTGLKDKNYVDLYYNDKIKLIFDNEIIFTVVKDDFDIPVFANFDMAYDIDFKEFFMKYKKNDFEIIGNTHENN